MRSEPIHTPQHPNSYYAATMHSPINSPHLHGSHRADICVIGGGFSGLNTAIELQQKGYSVILLEAHQIGWGASGRNGGQLIRGIGHDLQQFKSQIGEDGIASIQQMGVEAVEIVRQRISEFNIDCDLTWGYCDLAITPLHQQDIQETYRALESQNYPHALTLLENPEQIRQQVNSERYIGGLLDMGSGHLHPLNLCLGEARAAQKLGVRIFENSPVLHIQHQPSAQVSCAEGSVVCDKIVVCANAYVGDLDKTLGGKVLPAGSYLIATEPLDESLWRQLMPNQVAACDLTIALDYFRLSADKRLIFGGMCNYSGRHPRSITAALQPKMQRVFPQLHPIKIEYEWGGMIGIGANRLPQIGRLSKNLYYAQAYAGHGVNATHMAARLIANAIAGDEQGFDLFANIKHVTFPGGKYLRSPLLALGMLYHRCREWL